jgi:hypothetical protein
MLFCVDSNCAVQMAALSAATVHCVQLLVSFKLLFIGGRVSECCIISLLHARNQTVTLCYDNCTVAYVEEALIFWAKQNFMIMS